MKKLKEKASVSLKNKKMVSFGILVGVFLLGILFGVLLSWGGNNTSFKRACVLRYVLNPNIQENLHTCGQVPKTEPCALYIMNHTGSEKLVVDFIAEASRLTNTPVHLILSNNPTYINQRIVPGYFAQIKIPSLR